MIWNINTYHDNAGEHIEKGCYCYEYIIPALRSYDVVPSDGYLRRFSLHDRLKEVEKFEYMRKSEALAGVVKKILRHGKKSLIPLEVVL